MWLFNKRLEDLRDADLRLLIENQVRESVTLEFKRQMYRRKDEGETREMLKDISSMANAEGGTIIIGAEEDDLRLDPVIASLGEPPDQVARRVADRFWNAFHFMDCPFFGEDGGFFIPERS